MTVHQTGLMRGQVVDKSDFMDSAGQADSETAGLHGCLESPGEGGNNIGDNQEHCA